MLKTANTLKLSKLNESYFMGLKSWYGDFQVNDCINILEKQFKTQKFNSDMYVYKFKNREKVNDIQIKRVKSKSHKIILK